MKLFLLFLMLLQGIYVSSVQASLGQVEHKVFTMLSGEKIQGETGYFTVPENRNIATSRKIQVKYTRLKSISAQPTTPIVYVEGGSGQVTWQADDPKELSYWRQLIAIADLVFVDRRGVGDDNLVYLHPGEFPKDFFISEQTAFGHYQQMIDKAFKTFDAREVDVLGYTIEEHARDYHELMLALGYETYSVFGFSYGSTVSTTMMHLFPEHIERAVLAGADAYHQAFNYPVHLDKAMAKVSNLVDVSNVLSGLGMSFEDLVSQAIKKLEDKPAKLLVKNPLSGEPMTISVGAFGLALVLRLEIDDNNDIPVLPRLVYEITQDNFDSLTWFIQKRLVFALALPGGDITQYLASGASDKRWSDILVQAENSQFGNVVNFPFSLAKNSWRKTQLSFDSTRAIQSDIPTLFITGDMDCRTPVEQAENIRSGFVNAEHIQVKNAGHEQAHWQQEVADLAIPNFLAGKSVKSTSLYYTDIKFIPIIGVVDGHPSIE